MTSHQKTTDLKNTHGFSLVQTIIAMGLLMILALAIASMFNDMMKLNRNVMGTSEANSTMTLLGMYLGDQNTCDLNLVTLNTVQFDITQLKDLVIPVQKISFPANGSAPLEYLYNTENPVTISNVVRISNANLSNITYINLNSQSAKLNITFDKGPQTQGPQFITRSLYLKLESAAVSANVVKVTHCIAGNGTITPPTPTPLPNGQQPPPMNDISDQMFGNLMAAVNAVVSQTDKIGVVETTIKNWQNLGLVSKDRFISIGKFSTLIKDGYITAIDSTTEMCNFFSTHIIDPQNAQSAIPAYFSNIPAVDCTAKLGM